MNRLIAFILISLFITSCSKSKEYNLKEKIVSLIKKDMNNPNSFELVEFVVDSVQLKDIDLDKKSTSLSVYKSMSTEEYPELKQIIENCRKELAYLQSKSNPEEFVEYLVKIKMRGNNSFGALVVNTVNATILMNETNDIIELK